MFGSEVPYDASFLPAHSNEIYRCSINWRPMWQRVPIWVIRIFLAPSILKHIEIPLVKSFLSMNEELLER
jgi:hypothetical protein